ncbi:CmcI family methyltransferase [Halochromatium roseum]|nr:CmcI family methyltransferase [Halochromatium roseum]
MCAWSCCSKTIPAIQTHPEFEIDKQIDRKLLINMAPDGYLRRVG